MFDMAYCGYAEILIVIMFVVLFVLFFIVLIIIYVFFINFNLIIISLKFIYRFLFLDLEFLLTIWNILFILLVLLISIRVIVFSLAYINGYQVSNFVYLYVRFIISIVWLILNSNFYWIIFGWDGLGVVSFLLIVFYINNERINNGLFTLFQNRIGDLFFVLFILGSLNLLIANRILISWGLLFLILGRCVKRAQFPFNAWLLAAIRAPTPISSLVHSSTLVVAGVFIMLQYRYCLVDCLERLKFIRILSLIFRRFGLINEGDIKKLIAYSTIRHVSLIMYIISFKLFKIVYFHLNIHAIFKSLIFICFGFVILISYHSQDKRLVSFIRLNPVIKIIYYFSCLCLAGLPFLRAFFSKDLIVEKLIEFSYEFVYVIFLLLALRLRIYYSLKLLFINKMIFSYVLIEKNFFSMGRICIIIFVIIVIINIYLSLIFSLTLEFFSIKIIIYLFILFFRILSVFTNLNYKIQFYSKLYNFKEIWNLSLYSIDKFIFWNIFLMLNQFNIINSLKIFLVVNWWGVIIVLILF